MAGTAFERIMAGLEDALAHAEGRERGSVSHAVVVETVDVAAIRRRLNLSQSDFARTFALDVRAVQDWEQGRRRPDTAARAYLRVIGNDPDAVRRALAAE